MESELFCGSENPNHLSESVVGHWNAPEIGESEIPTDPSDKYFLTHCFVCTAVAKPDQVSKNSMT